MNSLVSTETSQAHVSALREAAKRRARKRARRRAEEDAWLIRRARPGDAPAIEALATLDGRQWCSGPVLVAEVDGSLRAALPLDGDAPFSDPFHKTAELVGLLEARARQLCETRRSGVIGRLTTLVAR